MRTVLIIILSIFSAFSFGQVKKEKDFKHFVVGQIPSLEKFEIMTSSELSVDSFSNQLSKMLDSLIKTDKSIEPSNQFKAKPENISGYLKAQTLELRENRSRYDFQYYKNNKVDKEVLKGLEGVTITSPCNCILSDDTIKVTMGFWVFGGFAFSIDIVGNKFSSQYIDDKHDKKVYKQKLTDTLNHFVVVNNNSQNLILNSKPGFIAGQSISGYLNFQTEKFYRSNDEGFYGLKKEYSDKNMDIVYLKGNLHFKCIVRKK
jgi:hypothetical protein